MKYAVVGCPRCGALRVVELGRKSAQCARCPNRIDLSHARRHFTSPSAEEARAYIGVANRGAAGGRREPTSAVPDSDLRAGRPDNAHARELRRIGESLGAARGPAGRLRLILRKGFSAFGHLTEADLDAIVRAGEVAETGSELAEAALDQGLAARGPNGVLIPLRDGN